jgi:polyhydroxyalkanoate synthesis regulator phasin
MTPKEKAKELIDKFTDVEDGEMYIGKAKQCALIAVDEIINSGKDVDEFADAYWQEVKQEIEKL